MSIFNSPSGISGPEFSFVPGKEIGNLNIGGVTPLGPNLVTPQNFTQNIFAWSDDLFYTRGRHCVNNGWMRGSICGTNPPSTLAEGAITSETMVRPKRSRTPS